MSFYASFCSIFSTKFTQSFVTLTTIVLSIFSSPTEIIAQRLLDNFNPQDTSSLSGHNSVLELLAQLSNRGGEIARLQIIHALRGLEWKGHTAVMLACALIECCICDLDCEIAIEKIEDVLTISLQHLSGENHHDLNSELCVDIEELPQLMYQMTLIGNRIENGMSAELCSKILECITMSMDTLLSMYFSDEKLTRLGLSQQRIENVCLTICHHMSLTVAKDQCMCQQIISDIKHRNIGSRSVSFENHVSSALFSSGVSSSDHRPNLIISTSMLTLAFMVAKSSREENKIMSLFLEIISEVSDVYDRISNSLWFKEANWAGGYTRISLSSLKMAFELLFSGPLIFEPIIRPIMNMAFSFIDACKSPIPSTWEKLTTASLHCTPRPKERQEGFEQFGSWLVIKLFCLCSHSRSQVVRELVVRFAAASSMSSSADFLGRTSNKTMVANWCLIILKTLCKDCREGILEVNNELHELFLYTTELSPAIASALISTLFPFFQLCDGMGDKCCIALRKACFSKDCSSRQAAVSSILSLLQSHLHSTNNFFLIASSSSQMSQLDSDQRSGFHDALRFQSQMKQRVVTGLSVEEIMVLLRRFLQHQSSVRSVLYKV